MLNTSSSPQSNFLKTIGFIIALLFVIPQIKSHAQINSNEEKAAVKTRILFVLDASRSMSGKWQGESKYTIARTILSEILDSIAQIQNTEVALRVYGHQRNYPPQNCNDTRLEVPFSANNIEQIKYRLKQLGPKGTSPIANSLLKAGDDFPDCDNCRNIVVLITDGIEECGGDICEISKTLQQKGVILKPFIIGIGANNHEVYDCAGEYFNATNKTQFSNTLKLIITKVLGKTTLQVNLLDQYNRPTVSNVNMTFYNKLNGQVKYNFVHTLNSKGFPDTLHIDHLIDYNLVINTLPPKRISPVNLIEGKHTIVSTICPQGSLLVSLLGQSKADFNPAIIVSDITNKQRINVQYLDQNVDYLAGKYNITILTLPPISNIEIDIEPDNQTKIEIENPGIAVIQKNIKGYGSIYQMEGYVQKWVIDFGKDNNSTESIYLQPGNYRLVYRSKYSLQSQTTLETDFEISSEKTTRIKL